MAIQYPQFNADPNIQYDFSAIANFLPNILAGYKAGSMPSQMRAEREKQKLANALTQQQTRNAELTNQYLPEVSQADISAKNAQATKARAFASIFGDISGINNNIQDIPDTEDNQDVILEGQHSSNPQYRLSQALQNNSNTQNPQSNRQVASQGNYRGYTPQQALAIKYATGLDVTQLSPKSEYIPNKQTGEIFQVTRNPLTGQESRQVISPFQDLIEHEKRKQEAIQGTQLKYENLKEIAPEISSDIQQYATLNRITDKFSDKNFINSVGIFNSAIQKWLPDEDPGKLKGEMDVLTGQIKGDIIKLGAKAPAAMGRFADELKPSSKDNAQIFYGKTLALKALKDWNIDFNNTRHDLIKNQGMDMVEASNQAYKDHPIDPYFKKAESSVNSAKDAGELKRKYPDVSLVVKNGNFYVTVPDTGKNVPPKNYEEAVRLHKLGKF